MSDLIVERKGSVAILTIDRPRRRNAIGVQLVEDLTREFARLDREADTRAIVLTGAAPGFCAGSDLKELAETDLAGMCAHEARTAALARSIAFLGTPVIAAVDGFALGGGFVLAISCDVVVTASEARWHLPEVSIGWIPPWGLQAVVARVGPVAARRLTWGAAPFDGREAHRLGLADALVAPGASVLEAALREAEALAALPPPAVASTKHFYAPAIAGTAEAADAWANRLFAADCGHPVAQGTLRRFGVTA
ncbi:Enoyl-CoA hydratase/isomerase [Methylobacterium sp. 4-46]|uniref:enoyl-CoA hydratase/isomerase family protein n=1 Tax=unclassified Methylobacterium TaxID=2615210 RepID=UPI000165C5E2|nr:MULTISPECIES: enoyl-CoA hydratase/isomerase family protein [Methylobacterium]ACA15854.1 Enoyl-CoA hydratase/isomerase [Methylobacterium sp. 4-46]WFT81582.1 enoyl-CoA hydratase/isomerase family protein [Methylobacterium nodulans]